MRADSGARGPPAGPPDAGGGTRPPWQLSGATVPAGAAVGRRLRDAELLGVQPPGVRDALAAAPLATPLATPWGAQGRAPRRPGLGLGEKQVPATQGADRDAEGGSRGVGAPAEHRGHAWEQHAAGRGGRAWTRARGCPGTPPEASGCLDPAARRPPASGPAPCGTLPGSWTPADRVHPTPSCSRPRRRPPAPPNAARSCVYRSHCDLTGPPARLARSPAPRTHRSSGEGGRRCQPRADPFAGRTV